MSQKDVRAVIETAVAAWAEENDFDDSAIAWENVAFAPPVGQYLKFNLLPAQTRSDDIAGQLRTWKGIVQLTLALPVGNGPALAETLIASLDRAFGASSYLPGPTLSVLVATPVSAANGFLDDAHYLVPVTFQYRADLSSV